MKTKTKARKARLKWTTKIIKEPEIGRMVIKFVTERDGDRPRNSDEAALMKIIDLIGALRDVTTAAHALLQHSQVLTNSRRFNQEKRKHAAQRVRVSQSFIQIMSALDQMAHEMPGIDWKSYHSLREVRWRSGENKLKVTETKRNEPEPKQDKRPGTDRRAR